MRRGSRLLAATAVAAVLSTGLTTGLASWSSAAPPSRDAASVAADRLAADATGRLTVDRGNTGAVRFVGAGGGEVRNPAVGASTGVRQAATAHLARYGAALGTSRDSAFGAAQDPVRNPAGQDVVRFLQSVGGLPVVAGAVAVTVAADKQLSSMLGSVSSARAVPAAVVSASTAAAGIRRAAAKLHVPADATITSQGRWIWDPAVFGVTGSPARGVWRFEVTQGATVRTLVLVDDQTGKPVFTADQIEHATDRIVCDDGGVPAAEVPCTTADAARTEGDPATGQADVDAAYDFAGEVADFYQQIAGVDLTQLLGVDESGTKKLASTVRYCPDASNCPYENAFWNGTQMFYGEDFATADDVVGHEMTHGVTDRNSSLFYFGQSGAMNESMSDIMGEIIDHRHGADDDSDWALAEDLPIGAIRNMKDPTQFGDPDRTGSPNWWNDLDPAYWAFYGPYPDNGGVHFNSGVGNKTAYLISQGGTFNGQTITGIDAGDPTLNKTALLYYNAIVSLVSGSDYADLANVLEQGCAQMVAAGKGGFTAADCAEIHKAVTATELRTTPVNAPQPPDAAKACPAGSTLRELFNSEGGDPSSKFTSASPSTWSYGVDPYWGSNATSGKDSWFSYDPDPDLGDPTSSSITMASGVNLPAGQPSFLWFNQWRLFEWYPEDGGDPAEYYDGGVVGIDDTATAEGPVDTATGTWVNGPQQKLLDWSGNSHGPRTVFGGDSFGWNASRLDLSGYAGKNVKVAFSSLGDEYGSFLGWWLDDISVYTCDKVATPPPPPPAAQPSSATGPVVKGKLGKAVVRWKSPTTNPTAVTGYRITGGGKTVTVAASAHRAVVKGLKNGKTYRFAVTALGANGYAAPAVQGKAKGTKVKLYVEGDRGSTGLSGKLKAGSKGLKGQVLKILTKQKGKWVKIDKVTTGKKGKFAVSLTGTSARPYKVLFAGAKGLMGSISPKKHLK